MNKRLFYSMICFLLAGLIIFILATLSIEIKQEIYKLISQAGIMIMTVSTAFLIYSMKS